MAVLHPSAQQILEAFPGDQLLPRLLIRDRDGIHGDASRRKVKAQGTEPVRTGREMPMQNACVERVTGTIRREA
ncbi:MAG: hypothetical protein CMJ83_14660 [Planctomycetes bacterium]|nr:hypothetical protein [Planctomycetota bacterium]